jgi:hypothetical protein
MNVIWRTFQNEPDVTFIDAVEFMIATYRAAPMMKEMHDAVNEARAAFKQREAQTTENRNMFEQMREGYNHAKFDDAEVAKRVKGRIELAQQYAVGKINKKHFTDGMNFYDKAAGFTREDDVLPRQSPDWRW